MSAPRIFFAGDSALVAQFDDRIDAAVSARVVALARVVERAMINGVRDVVPTFRSLAVYYDPVRADVDELSEFLEKAASATGSESQSPARPLIRVPVRYGGSDGPDLEDVAAFAGITTDEVVAAHTGRTYRVFMLGFVPGFAYMASVDGRIAMPRLDSPRTRVPAGSVAIAGVQTGIYPAETPGGWRLIGRTTLKPFDLAASDPFAFKTGDHVQFYAETTGR